jgi:thioredoxin 1
MIFYENNLPEDLRRTLDDLARQYAGKILIVTLARSDASQAAARYNVRGFPAFIGVRDGKTVTSREGVRASDIKPQLAYLLGEGPRPTPRVASQPGVTPKQATGPGPISVNEANWQREVLQSDRPVLVDFWAPWCAPCRMVEPTVEALAHEQVRTLKVVKVNVDENPGLASRYRAMSIPLIIVVKGGQEVDRWVGALPDKVIRSRVSRWL